MSTTMKSVLSLMLVLATCWADIPGDPILDNINPRINIEDVLGEYRLPKTVEPIEYSIQLEPFIDISDPKTNFTFVGESVIKLKVTKETNNITFHGKELDFLDIKLLLDNKPPVSLTGKEEKDTEKDFVILLLSTPITPNMTVTLKLKYTGQLNDKLIGFYRSSYVNEKNERRWLATTQFEPVGARQAFPCWDEPEIKANFEIKIKHDKKYKAISNTAINKINNEKENKSLTIFKRTPKMSTYLIAFVIADYEKYAKDDLHFNVWTKPHAINSTKYAYEVGKQLLKELDEWTDIKYKDQGIDKLDQISIPDFKAGAMENWGLVTYRESALLNTEGKTTTKTKQDIATVIAHEFAHQWFGNLVTAKWWDHIWLNEGFATFFQYYITEKALLKQNETWRLMEQFVINNVQVSSFGIDATTKTRPMNAKNIKTPEQISSLFDNIAYKKAASVIRMMQHFLSDTVFQKGIKKYLNDHKTAVAIDSNLFNSINSIIPNNEFILPDKLSLMDVMNNWVNQPGYPVVTVAKKSNNEIELKQQRFFLAKPVQHDSTQWYIPIDYIQQDSNNTFKIKWMEPSKNFTLKLEANKWILINNNQAGYYRVNYDTENWKLLTENLKKENFGTINAVSRAQLIDDALNLARAGDLEYSTALEVTLYLSQEKDYIPWYAAAKEINYLDNLLRGTKKYKLFRKYVAHKLESFTDEVKLENTAADNKHVDKLAKVLALNMACKYGVKKCEEYAEKTFNEWLENKNNPWIDYRKDVLCAGLRNANEETWNKALTKYLNSLDSDERKHIVAGLGCATNEKIVNVFLNLTLQDNFGISVFDTLDSIYQGNPASVDFLISFIGKNLEKIRGPNGENSKALTQHLNLLANRITTSEQYTDLSLLIHLQQQDVSEAMNRAIENINWIKRYRENVNLWIQANQPASQPSSASSFAFTSLLLIIPMLLARL